MAAMMRGLQDRALDVIGMFFENRGFRIFLGVTRKEHREIAVRQAADDGFVVRIVFIALLLTFFDRRFRRTEHREFDAVAEIERIPLGEFAVFDALGFQRLHVAYRV